VRVELHRAEIGHRTSMTGSFMALLGKKGRPEDPDTFEEVVELLSRLTVKAIAPWEWVYLIDADGVRAVLRNGAKGIRLSALRSGESSLHIKGQTSQPGRVDTVQFNASPNSLERQRVTSYLKENPQTSFLAKLLNWRNQPIIAKTWVRAEGPAGFRVLSRGTTTASTYTCQHPHIVEG